MNVYHQCQLKFITGVNDTGDKFITGVNDLVNDPCSTTGKPTRSFATERVSLRRRSGTHVIPTLARSE
jgi:hypothetical protein